MDRNVCLDEARIVTSHQSSLCSRTLFLNLFMSIEQNSSYVILLRRNAITRSILGSRWTERTFNYTGVQNVGIKQFLHGTFGCKVSIYSQLWCDSFYSKLSGPLSLSERDCLKKSVHFSPPRIESGVVQPVPKHLATRNLAHKNNIYGCEKTWPTEGVAVRAKR